jgi:PPOX class probable F420-dependent enzyme
MAEFVPVHIDHAREFLRKHHWGILATRRKNGNLQMSPVTVGVDAEGRAIISSRETAYKVNNLRRDPRAALCAVTNSFPWRRLGADQRERGNRWLAERP